MSRVLHRPGVAAAPRVVAPVEPSLDPAVRGLIDRAAAEAYERGVADGRRAGRDEGRHDVAQLGATVAHGLAGVVAAVRAMRAEQAEGTVALATAIAAHVLDREPGDDAQALLGRVRAWLGEVDDRPLQLAVSATDADTLSAALAAEPTVEVVVDADLGTGEARLVGAWSTAELTRAARWENVRQLLCGESTLTTPALPGPGTAAAGRVTAADPGVRG